MAVRSERPSVEWLAERKASHWADDWDDYLADTMADMTVGSLADYPVGHWAATMVFRWADPKASQTVVLMVDGSAVQTVVHWAVVMDAQSVAVTVAALVDSKGRSLAASRAAPLAATMASTSAVCWAATLGD
jgi:hypothetical protein